MKIENPSKPLFLSNLPLPIDQHSALGFIEPDEPIKTAFPASTLILDIPPTSKKGVFLGKRKKPE